jgi:phosphate-induced protein 1
MDFWQPKGAIVAESRGARLKAGLGLLLCLAALALLAVGCGSASDDSGDETRQALGRDSNANRCPDGKRPTINAASIGLVASKTYGSRPGAKDDSAVVDSRCLTQPIQFAVPKWLTVTQGDAGKGEASLSFHDPASRFVVDCEYRGTSRRGEPSNRYALQLCRHSYGRVDETSPANWFRLEIESARREAGKTEVRLELGTPDPSVPLGVVAANPKLAGASLEVPPGAASPFEHFALEPVAETEPGLPLNYGAKSTIAASYGVFVRALERGDAAPLLPAPSGEHFKLSLPYDPAVLASLGAQENDLVVLEVSGMGPWSFPEILRVRNDFTIDPLTHTVTLNADNAVGYLSVVNKTRTIPYNGGPVMKGRVPVHLLYYGTVTSFQRTVIEDFVRGLGATPWLHILDSYDVSDAARPTTNIALGETVTVSNPNTSPGQPTTTWVAKAVQDAIDKKKPAADGNAIYLVIAGKDVAVPALDNATDTIGSCGWHTSMTQGLFQPTIKYGLIKNLNGNSGCSRFKVNSPQRDILLDSMMTTIAHEIVETLSDPEDNSGWAALVGSKDVENADNCSGLFGPRYTVFTDPSPAPKGTPIQADLKVGIRDFLVQKNWVNIGNGYGYCAMRIETDDARGGGLSTTLPDPPAGETFHPMIYGKQYTAFYFTQNTGDTVWRDEGASGEQYSLGSQSQQDNDLFNVGGRVPVATDVNPGASYLFTFPFSAGANLSPGVDQTFQWRMVREAVRWFGDLTEPITVRGMFNASEAVPPQLPFTHPNEPVTLSVTFKNTSGVAWRSVDGYYLQLTAPDFRGATRLELAFSKSAQPGETATFFANLTAPFTVGEFPTRWQMAQDGVGPFGAVLETSVTVAGVDRAAFVSQSVPEVMELESTYEVRAKFHNTGSSTWTSELRLDVAGPFRITAGGTLLSSIPPDHDGEIVATITPTNPNAPLPAHPALSLGLAHGDRVLARGPDVVVEVRQGSDVLLAECKDHNVPPRMVSGRRYPITVDMYNAGGRLWTTAMHLGSTPPGDTTWGIGEVALSRDVPARDTYRFQFDITAPDPGDHTFAFMMYESAVSGSYFFDACVQEVTVYAADWDDAALVSATFSDLVAGGSTTFRITMRNTGSSTWTAGGSYQLWQAFPSESSPWGWPSGTLASGEAIAPGESKEFTVPISAYDGTAGQYTALYRMIHGATTFGADAVGDVTIR